MVQMPGGIPVATFAVGEAGATNAALFAAAMLALSDAGIAKKLSEFRARQTERCWRKPCLNSESASPSCYSLRA